MTTFQPLAAASKWFRATSACALALAANGGAMAQGVQTTRPQPAPLYSAPSGVGIDNTTQRTAPVYVVPQPGAASTQTTPSFPQANDSRQAPASGIRPIAPVQPAATPGMRAITPIRPAPAATPPRYTPPPVRNTR